MNNETIEGFARYRLNKAKETLETARMIFNEGKDFTSANNRAYYAIFYAIIDIDVAFWYIRSIL